MVIGDEVDNEGSICLCSSKPNKIGAGVSSKESKDLFLGSVPSPETGQLMLKTWLPDGLQEMDCTGGDH